jgi:uncharacterized GH25 family protein
MMVLPGTAHLAASLLALASAVPAFAHDTWLQGPRLPIASGSTVLFELTSGGAFPSLDHAVDAGRIAREGIRVGGMTRRFKMRSRGKEALRLQVPLAVEGVAVAFVSLKPQPLELKPPQVEEYLEEIGERERVGREWERGPRKWREVYRKHAKTFLRVGQASGSPGAWGDPVGLDLEIVPESDPTLLQPGDALSVVVLSSGHPMPGFTLAATDGRERRFQRTDAAGRATVRLDRPGRWLLAGTYLRRVSRSDADWESDFTTLTLQVAALENP